MLPRDEDHIKPICASTGLTVRRADDFFTAHSVVQDIWKAIVKAVGKSPARLRLHSGRFTAPTPLRREHCVL